MPVKSPALVQHYQQNRVQATTTVTWYEDLANRIGSTIQRLTGELEQARLELARAYLDTLSAEALEEVERMTGFRGFSRKDPLQAMDRERSVLQKTVLRIEADDRYRRREYLVGSMGELTRAVEEARSLLEPWEQECARFESLDGFNELVSIGYDTPAFAESWFQPSYWRHWAAGDAVCGALGMDDFGDDVLPAYQKVAAEREKWQQQVADAVARVDAILAVVQEHDDALARLPRLPEIYLDQAQALLARFLDDADLPLLEQWLTREADDDTFVRGAKMGLRKVAGLKAKLRYLEEMLDQGIQPVIGQLRRSIDKYARKEAKYSRSKYHGQTFPESAMDDSFRAKAAKLEANRDKLEVLVGRVSEYNDYGRFDLQNEPELWWYEFTGKPPSRFTPTTRSWWDRNPGTSIHHDPLDDRGAAEAVAVAAVSREQDGLDFVS